jgi:hypothetical protein
MMKISGNNSSKKKLSGLYLSAGGACKEALTKPMGDLRGECQWSIVGL